MSSPPTSPAPSDTSVPDRTEVPAPPVPELAGRWRLRAMASPGSGARAAEDLDLVYQWMRTPHVAAFWAQAWTRHRWEQEIDDQLAGAHSRPVLALRDGVPLGYLEIYRVCRNRLAAHYPFLPHDVGVHLAIGDRAQLGQGLGRELLVALATAVLAEEPACRRVVAEPAVANVGSVRCFLAAGFRHLGEITLPDKLAALMVRPRSEGDLPT
ncbi:GNAT family N-acetyltransferase [Actinoalloteichus caeruleus]|uniref:Lysine N-acyltransferase MbtK n=1 Tax=Actinoalloteichus caeruleus DSM 43889 TaxID=1120930 RepID=A0ABT1JG98_ACTCY|nr:GNAT family N-acetyltransferase [Actinoalloteichus caeruleus]MCP2331473.1 Protein N-acetyltransferase, RimJ/RimL family [Actinoalloteichus caeruleus DSM 43889]